MTNTNDVSSGRKPTHTIYNVIGEGEKARWTRIGAAWAHKDGKGLNLEPEYIPIYGRIVIRVSSDQKSG